MSDDRRVVMVTGGGTGIGFAVAERFLSAGDEVVIVGRRTQVLEQAATSLGGDVVIQTADVSERDQVVGAVGAVIDRFERLDVVVNNAGLIEGTLASMEIGEAEAAWDAVHDANLKGSFLMSIAAAGHLTRPGGRIINVGSIAAFTGGSRPGAIAYASAKSGLHGMTYGLARELSPEGITANVVAPGFIENTEFTGQWPEERVRSIVAEVPAGRAGSARDVAEACFYLASEAAAFVTGESLTVNGGWRFAG